MMRILFALAGLHRIDRGAEVAFISIAEELAKLGHEVTLVGGGQPRSNKPYAYIPVPALARERFERWPKLPIFRNETVYEEASFAAALLRHYRPRDYDITVSCTFPFTNWALRRSGKLELGPRHVYVTQNGDWPAFSNAAEYRWFGCDGLVCTNPDYFERNRASWTCALIPNGIHVERFAQAEGNRDRLGLPSRAPLVLMVSALIPSKRVLQGIQATSEVAGAHLVVAGDGPQRAEVDQLAAQLLPNRFTRLTLGADEMPILYRSCDAFLHLSSDESFGNVYLEAAAAGLPIVAIDTPRTRWILGDNALLATEGDLGGIIACIHAALASGAARPDWAAHLERFRWSNIAREYARFFQRIRDIQSA
jgi:glycosyltransferase involved in cell wall biosynthesis